MLAGDSAGGGLVCSLLTTLKAQGLPAAKSRAENGAGTGVELVFESKVTRELSIPGVISCSSDEDCPTGKTCSGLLVCQ